MKKKIIGALCQVSIAYWWRETSVRQYIGVPIPPRAITIGGPMVVLHLIWLVRTKEIKKKRRTKQFGAPHLFSSQSPINSALQTGNGNTLKKRRRQN
jgi:hypothetical protein